MKNVKKIALALVCVMLVGMLSGCGLGFDVAAYLKANLDNLYKNDSTDLVKMKIGTAEEAETVYKQGIDAEVDGFLKIMSISASEELEQEFHEIFEEIFSKVKYTVDKAEKQDDGSYVVTITCEQMQFFGPMTEKYIETVESLQEDVAFLSLSESEQMEKVNEELKEIMKSILADVEYAEPVEATVTIERGEKGYLPRQSDLSNLEMELLDIYQFSNN